MIATVVADFLAGGLIAGVAFMAGVRTGRRQPSDLQALHDKLRRLYDDVRDKDAA